MIEIYRSNVEEPVDETMQEDQEDNEGKKVKAKEPSKRKLKKEKAEARAAVVKEVGKQESAQKALNYISKVRSSCLLKLNSMVAFRIIIIDNETIVFINSGSTQKVNGSSIKSRKSG